MMETRDPVGGSFCVEPAMALSLTVLQEKAAKRGQALPEELAHLGGVNRIQGFMMEPDGEILLLGERDPSLPPYPPG